MYLVFPLPEDFNYYFVMDFLSKTDTREGDKCDQKKIYMFCLQSFSVC